jgi:hypothetical protein
MSIDNLYRASKKCCCNARWKTSTIKFEKHLLSDAMKISRNLEDLNKRRFYGYHSFTLVEHGKVREIDALTLWDRAP